MNHARHDVEAAVSAAFPHGHTAAVLAALDLYGTEPHERERERVQLAIVALCQGDEARLRNLVESAKKDYRDVLYWVESGPLSKAEGQRQQELVRGLLEKWGKK
jgi:hypothetical protein